MQVHLSLNFENWAHTPFTLWLQLYGSKRVISYLKRIFKETLINYKLLLGHHFYIGRGMEYSNYIMTRPKPPQDLDVRPSEEKIVVSWKEPVETPENNTIKYYNVYVRVCSEDSKCTDSKFPNDSLTNYITRRFNKFPDSCFRTRCSDICSHLWISWQSWRCLLQSRCQLWTGVLFHLWWRDWVSRHKFKLFNDIRSKWYSCWW